MTVRPTFFGYLIHFFANFIQCFVNIFPVLQHEWLDNFVIKSIRSVPRHRSHTPSEEYQLQRTWLISSAINYENVRFSQKRKFCKGQAANIFAPLAWRIILFIQKFRSVPKSISIRNLPERTSSKNAPKFGKRVHADKLSNLLTHCPLNADLERLQNSTFTRKYRGNQESRISEKNSTMLKTPNTTQ